MLNIFIHSILTTLGGRYWYHSRFDGEKTGPERLSSLPKVTQQASDSACIQTQTAWLWSLHRGSHRMAHCALFCQAGETHLLPGPVQAGGCHPLPKAVTCSCDLRWLTNGGGVGSPFLSHGCLSPPTTCPSRLQAPGPHRGRPAGASLNLDKC